MEGVSNVCCKQGNKLAVAVEGVSNADRKQGKRLAVAVVRGQQCLKPHGLQGRRLTVAVEGVSKAEDSLLHQKSLKPHEQQGRGLTVAVEGVSNVVLQALNGPLALHRCLAGKAHKGHLSESPVLDFLLLHLLCPEAKGVEWHLVQETRLHSTERKSAVTITP